MSGNGELGGDADAQQSETDAVRAANDAYYAALSARDLDAMCQLWSQTAEVVNIAPPVRPAAHVGWDAVKKNYVNFWGTLDWHMFLWKNPRS